MFGEGLRCESQAVQGVFKSFWALGSGVVMPVVWVGVVDGRSYLGICRHKSVGKSTGQKSTILVLVLARFAMAVSVETLDFGG